MPMGIKASCRVDIALAAKHSEHCLLLFVDAVVVGGSGGGDVGQRWSVVTTGVLQCLP